MGEPLDTMRRCALCGEEVLERLFRERTSRSGDGATERYHLACHTILLENEIARQRARRHDIYD